MYHDIFFFLSAVSNVLRFDRTCLPQLSDVMSSQLLGKRASNQILQLELPVSFWLKAVGYRDSWQGHGINFLLIT